MNSERYKSIQDHYKMAKREGASLHYTMVGDCLDEIERLQKLLKRIRDDKGGDVWCTFSFNPKKAIDTVLEAT